MNTGLALGGICVNVGCVPSKHLLAVGHTVFEPPQTSFDAVQYSEDEPTTDWAAALDEKDRLVGHLREENYVDVADHFGTDVTLVQRNERLIPREEPDTSATIEAVFTDKGITVRTDTEIEALADSGEGITATPSGEGAEVTASAVLVAAGRQPNTDDLGLEETNVKVDEQGFIDTPRAFETADATIYAMGDVTGPPMFIHSARDDADRLYCHLIHDEDVTVADRVVSMRYLPTRKSAGSA